MIESNLCSCVKVIEKHNVSCPCQDCRCWMEWEDDLNCAVHAADKYGTLTFREIGERLKVSAPRVKQNEDTAIAKLAKKIHE